MGEHLQRAKQIAHQSACTTDVWIKLSTLQGLIADIETLQAACDEYRSMEPHASPRSIGGVVDLASKRGKVKEPEEEKP
jgi:hypothetical protein